MHDSSILSRRQGRIGRVTLNRPGVLNALDLAMIHAIQAALDDWRDDPLVHAVVMDAAPGRAFCAGGDIRALRALAMAEDYDAIERFFTAEYALNLAIAQYPKPYISLIDGICMGGGVGISIHGAVRVATEAAQFAMPEAAIGMFPDVGGSFLLPRLRDGFGLYLGLTGARVSAADAVYLGLATHFVPQERIGALARRLAEDGICALAEAAVPPPRGTFPDLAGCLGPFDASSVRDILGALERLDTEWSRATAATMRASSPTALLWAFELIRRGAGRTLKACLQAELALTPHVMRHPDFREGVRAHVIDKDRTPSWSPARVESVAPESIAALFG